MRGDACAEPDSTSHLVVMNREQSLFHGVHAVNVSSVLGLCEGSGVKRERTFNAPERRRDRGTGGKGDWGSELERGKKGRKGDGLIRPRKREALDQLT